MKKLDLNKSVYELTEQYPELIDILDGLGLHDITKKAMRNSVGRIMTIPKGAKAKSIDVSKVIYALISHGFVLVGKRPDSSRGKVKAQPESLSDERRELLKSYLKRLGAGEELESVREDFVENFKDVEASEIMKAEQELMAEGTPLAEVQRLCDVHSALFHGTTREEQIANAEKAVEASLKKADEKKADYKNKNELAAKLVKIDGHVLNTLSKENGQLDILLEEINNEIEKNENIDEILKEIKTGVTIHYAKKGDLLYPHLKVKYDISGPSDVMWTVDDEIRDELSALCKAQIHGEDWSPRVKAVLTRAKEMIYKENNILFPICAVNFTDDEWEQIYFDSKDYDECFGVDITWAEVEKEFEAKDYNYDGEVNMPGGHLTVEQLTAVLNTIPMEISFVDENNINRFFNEGEKAFKRPTMAIDREVFSCHPPKIEPMVRAIIEDFREGKRDQVPVWMEKNGKLMLVTYNAVRDKNDKYLGTMELVQDMEFAKEYFEK